VSLWIFGYGSLLWRPGFAFDERRPALVRGFERRLHQGSPDHRGTPDRPGRVVTLVRVEAAVCGGVAYRLAAEDAPAILDALDLREQGGYERLELDAVLAGDERPVKAITWVASPDNPHHLGPAPLADMVAHIRGAAGPSGSNLEYVVRLDETLRALGFHDPHVATVASALREGIAAPPVRASSAPAGDR
jgi:glutathione-specific gamma-glutamylcyclotransferase